MFWPKIVPNSWQYQSMFPFHALTSLVFLPCQHPNMTSSGPTNPHTASIMTAAKETMGSRVSFCMYSLIFNGTYSLLYSNPFLSLYSCTKNKPPCVSINWHFIMMEWKYSTINMTSMERRRRWYCLARLIVFLMYLIQLFISTWMLQMTNKIVYEESKMLVL